MNRLVTGLVVLLCIGTTAQSEERFLPILRSTFKIPAGSASFKAGCNNCHAGPPTRNVFGKAVEKALGTSPDLTPTMLLSIEKLDSDGDGYTNGEELRAGFLPGDPSSHPDKHEAAAAATAPVDTSQPLIPKHSFHPVFIHFPIALYLFGVFLEVVGIWKRQEKLRDAAYWNLLAAAASLAIVVPTGLIASFRQGYTLAWGQPVFTHFLLAIGATIGMVITILWNRKSRPASAGYWILILVTATLVGVAGHFGGNLVY